MDNAARLTEIGRLGRGALLDVALIDDGGTLAAVTTSGIWRFDADALDVNPAFTPFDPNPFGNFSPISANSEIVVSEDKRFIQVNFRDTETLFDLENGEVQTGIILDVTPEPPLEIEDAELAVYSPTNDTFAYQRVAEGDVVLQADGELRLTNLPTSGNIHLRRLLFSKDGSTLYVITSDAASAIYAVDVETGAFIGSVGGFYPFVSDLAFNADGTQIAAAQNDPSPFGFSQINPANGAQFYDLTTGTEGAFFPSVGAVSVAVAPSGMVAVSAFQAITIFDDGDPDRDPSVYFDEALPFYITQLAYNEDETQLAVAISSEIAIFNGVSLIERLPIATPMSVFNKGFAWDGETLIYLDGDKVQRRNSVTGETLETLSIPGAPARTLAFNPTQRLLAVQTDNAGDARVHLWDLSGEHAVFIRTIETPVSHRTLAFSPDGSLLLTAADANGDISGPIAVLYDTATGNLVDDTLDCGLPAIFHPDGRTLFCTFGAYIIAYGIEG